MEIKREQLEQLARIYNTLLNISTRGEDTLVMADCLRALEQVIKQIDTSANEASNSEAFQPEIVEE